MTASSRFGLQNQQYKLKSDINSKPHRSTIDSTRFSNTAIEIQNRKNPEFLSQDERNAIEESLKKMDTNLKLVFEELKDYLNGKSKKL